MEKKGQSCKCRDSKGKMLMARRRNTLAELDEKIKEMAEELWELRVFRAEIRKVIDGEKTKAVKVGRGKGKYDGKDL